MLQQNEIRIGNKVKCAISNDHGIYTVLAIPGWYDGERVLSEPQVTIDRCPKQTVPISKLRPIKLTPEILKEYGFNYDLHTYALKNIWLSEGEKGFNLWLAGLSNGIHTTIHYLHQLQNLHHILFGRELEIKLQTT